MLLWVSFRVFGVPLLGFFFSEIKAREQAQRGVKSVVNAGLMHAVLVMLAVHMVHRAGWCTYWVPREGYREAVHPGLYHPGYILPGTLPGTPLLASRDPSFFLFSASQDPSFFLFSASQGPLSGTF